MHRSYGSISTAYASPLATAMRRRMKLTFQFYWSLSQYGVAETDVVVMDQPSFLSGVGIALAVSDFWRTCSGAPIVPYAVRGTPEGVDAICH